MERTAPRRERLRRLLKRSGADAILVTSVSNVTYLTGFTGDDSYLLVTRDGQILVTDSRYTIQLSEECPGLELEVRQTGSGKTIVEATAKVAKRAKIAQLAIEANVMTVALRDQLSDKLPRVKLLSTSGLVEELRSIKDREEVAEIRGAVRIAEKAFGVVRAGLRRDQTEKQIADDLDGQIRLFGGQGCSFVPIVAAGPRAALPHAPPTEAMVAANELLLVDWGAKAGLYLSDLTRVLVTGRISPKLERIYRVVLKAQERAIASIRPGVLASKVDMAARTVIEKAGFGKNFGHGLGHGVGLDIHEDPRLSKTNSETLRPGMVITIEPGIYVTGFGGVRIEDDVLVTRDGHEVLTSVPKQWDETSAIL
jgi:Xaa-Pro aminopeptidase